MTNQELAKVANEVRKGVVTAVHAAKSGHPGGSLGAADIMTYLYFEEMNIDPADPHKADRDRFVLSKGHAAPGLYAALAERGYFPVEDLKTLRKIGSYLQGHPNMNETPGVDMSTGSLGDTILQFAFMSMGLRGAVVFLPLCAALWLPGRIDRKFAMASIIIAPICVLLFGTVFSSLISFDSLFIGILASLIIMGIGLAAGRKKPQLSR